MADHDLYGTVSVSDPPVEPDQVVRLAELDQAIAAAKDRAHHSGTQSADTLTDGETQVAMRLTERTKLAAVAPGATANSPDSHLLDRRNHHGTQSADTITDGTSHVAMRAAERQKLAGVAPGATANATDGALRDRSTHTGTQPTSSIAGFAAEVRAIIESVVDAEGAVEALDTLRELAQALGNDPNFSATVTGLINAIDARVDALESAAPRVHKVNIGDGSARTFTITHGFATRDVLIEVIRTSDGQTIYPVARRPTGGNTVTLDFGTTVLSTDAARAIITPK